MTTSMKTQLYVRYIIYCMHTYARGHHEEGKTVFMQPVVPEAISDPLRLSVTRVQQIIKETADQQAYL